MISIAQIASLAYAAHFRANIGREPIVPWAAIDTKAQAAWIAAVQAVRAEIERH